MRENTPDPFEDFEDPDFYYESYKRPSPGESYDYPESAYGVVSSPDNGYWITRIAHRIPNANPSWEGAMETGQFFTAQDESSANEVLDELGSKYVIIDYELVTGKFWAMAIWAEKSQSQFFEEYRQETAKGDMWYRTLYYPEYYRSMCSRLYNFGGEAVVPDNSTTVISYKEITVLGTTYKQISSTKSFATYEEAQEYVESQTAPNYRIVGVDPFTSPVPLEELDHYRLVHRSDPEVVEEEDEPISYVKIFEYLP